MHKVRFALVAFFLVATAADASERFHRQKNRISNRYTVEVAVKQKAVIHNLARTLPLQFGGRLIDVFDHVLGGFVVEMPEAQAIALSRHPGIKGVHEVPVVQPADTVTVAATSWGLNRIDQRSLPLDSWYTYSYVGTGITVYVIDTGVNVVGDLVNRVALRHDVTGTGLDDCWSPNGHGTMVASTVGGTTYGVARDVRLVGVKAFGCTDTTRGTDRIIAALNWIVATRPATELSVANISLGASADVTLDIAVRDTIAADVTVVVAAGNVIADACLFSPARTGNPAQIPDNPGGLSAITVAASDGNDQVAWWSLGSGSNTGPCVDLFAPGGSGLTAQGSNGVETNWRGTSAASPHVAGIAGLTFAKYGDITPGMVETYILQNSTADVITNNPNGATMLAGTPTRLVFQVQPTRRRACCS